MAAKDVSCGPSCQRRKANSLTPLVQPFLARILTRFQKGDALLVRLIVPSGHKFVCRLPFLSLDIIFQEEKKIEKIDEKQLGEGAVMSRSYWSSSEIIQVTNLNLRSDIPWNKVQQDTQRFLSEMEEASAKSQGEKKQELLLVFSLDLLNASWANIQLLNFYKTQPDFHIDIILESPVEPELRFNDVEFSVPGGTLLSLFPLATMNQLKIYKLYSRDELQEFLKT